MGRKKKETVEPAAGGGLPEVEETQAPEPAEPEAEATEEGWEWDACVVAPGCAICCGLVQLQGGDEITPEHISRDPDTAATAFAAHFEAGTIVAAG